MANKMGITVSTDLNYRKKLWKYGKAPSEVMPDLVAGCDIILGNEEDAEKCKKRDTAEKDTFYSIQRTERNLLSKMQNKKYCRYQNSESKIINQSKEKAYLNI